MLYNKHYRRNNMSEKAYEAIYKLLFTEDKYAERYREYVTVKFFENTQDTRLSLAIVAYLEAKLKHDNKGNVSLGIAQTPNFDILALEMDINTNERVAVSISELGAIYGLWFKKDDIYINSSISVGASFRESIVLAGLIIEASLHFKHEKKELMKLYNEVLEKIESDDDITQLLHDYTHALTDFAADFVWLNNSGEISYRELYIASLPHTSKINKSLLNGEEFILFPNSNK